jgi:hypothetical protein
MFWQGSKAVSTVNPTQFMFELLICMMPRSKECPAARSVVAVRIASA